MGLYFVNIRNRYYTVGIVLYFEHGVVGDPRSIYRFYPNVDDRTVSLFRTLIFVLRKNPSTPTT